MSLYAERHCAGWMPTYYDAVVYDSASYDAFIWHLQKPILVRVFRSLASVRERLKYLDFACGTGRVIAAVEGIAAESVGLDIPPLGGLEAPRFGEAPVPASHYRRTR